MKKILIIIGLFLASNVGASIPALEGEPPPLDCNQRYMSSREKSNCRLLEETRKLDNKRIAEEKKIAEQRQIEQEEKARFEKEQFERLEAERLEKERLEAEQKEQERLETILKVEAQEKEMEELKKLIVELQLKVIELIKELIKRGIIPEIVA